MANRSDTFPDLEASARGASAPGVTTASVTGLVLRGVKVLTPALTPAAVHLLALLVEHVHGDDRWRRGRLRVVPSNARLAAMMGTCERGIRRLLSLLEANHWIVRRYTASNRRSRPEAGIDLAPVAARLADLREAVEWVAEEGREARRQADAERDDAGTGSRTPESGMEDISVRLKSYSGNPKPTASVQRAEAGAGGELVSLMLHASPRLQGLLSPHDLIDLQRPRPPGPALNRLTAAVGAFVRELGLSSGIWTEALARHGWAALAAAVVVMERQGVKRRAGYLCSMLRHPKLAETVCHSLRRLVDKGCGA
ncbi:helix-turn-helix domain-containing protein [Caenispirillum bisanense]|nr:helix-turn-helix domain-containing protein [Caenispirillum bisanense]